ncbi:AMP-binding enzyme family protein [Mycobacterium kansasii]|uniref:AMP-binding enzyme family protein n=1 Tax=Mycobacterium kansasii TaxID=1768 RepID=A0A1V3X3C7_MYCKA|nr:AMP-binding enzyme family protein [Mycobacterium kansasii]
MALNIADLAEHAIDAVPDRVALICGDEQLTYALLEEKANRLAHYLLDQGVQKGDKVGLYCRNRNEIVIAMLGIVKAGAILVNVNYRYVEGELRYLFDNSDMVALVHERQYCDRVANVLPDTPTSRRSLWWRTVARPTLSATGEWSSTPRWSRARRSVTSVSEVPTTSTCCIRVVPRASRRA